MAFKQNDKNKKKWRSTQLDSSTSGLENPPPIHKQVNTNYQKEKANINKLETLIELVENDIFKLSNCKRIKNNMSNQERNRRTYKKTHQKHIAYKIKDHILLYLAGIVILKRLITNLKEVIFSN